MLHSSRQSHMDPEATTNPILRNRGENEVAKVKEVDTEALLHHVRAPVVRRLIFKSQIGAGGMGAVAEVEDRALQRDEARKTIHDHLRSNSHAQMMFVREARVTGQLEHPNIVPVHHIGIDADERVFFTMKKVDGKTLQAIIKERPTGKIKHEQLLNLIDVVLKVCHALAFAHSRGVIHCDVKPSNVMVGDFDQVYLMDWGVARDLHRDRPETENPDESDAVHESGISGTPNYMPSELAMGDHDRVNQRADVFTVGALLYEILTQRPPFQAPTLLATMVMAAGGMVRPPEEVVGDAAVPPALGRIVMKAMARDPDDRYQSIEDLQQALLQYVRGGSQFPRATFSAGEPIIHEGEEGKSAYSIVSGRCEVAIGSGAERQVLRVMEAGESFGETAFLSPGPRTATVIALEDTVLEVVTREIFERELVSMKPWMATFIRTLADRFRGLKPDPAPPGAASE